MLCPVSVVTVSYDTLFFVRLLVEKGARLDARNNKGWLPLTIAEGIEYTPDIFKRYPETAEALRQMMRERGLPVPALGNAE